MSKSISKGQKKVFFHVGLQRTGSTFLQRSVFPALQGIEYIPKKNFVHAFDIIKNTRSDKILVSREFNKSFFTSIHHFAERVDCTVYPIIVLRRHDDWIVSQYKRHIKNGYNQSIDRFFPLNGSEGYLNSDALDFLKKLEYLKAEFRNDPIVLFYEDLHRDASSFIEKLVDLLQIEIDWKKVRLRPLHTSYSDHQLKFIYWSYQHLFKNSLRETKAYRYLMLYLARLIPTSWIKDIQLFPEQYLQNVRNDFLEDWNKCIEYVKNQSR